MLHGREVAFSRCFPANVTPRKFGQAQNENGPSGNESGRAVAFRYIEQCARLLLRRGIVVADFFPIYNVPPGFDIIRPAVLVFQVVRVLPDIQTHNGFSPGHQWIVLVWRGFNRELTVLEDHPGPARPESSDAGLREFRLEIRERTEC
jgi:hypothetical protein